MARTGNADFEVDYVHEEKFVRGLLGKNVVWFSRGDGAFYAKNITVGTQHKLRALGYRPKGKTPEDIITGEWFLTN